MKSVTIEIEDVEGPTVLARIGTDAGSIDVIADIHLVDRVLSVDRLHIQGLKPGGLGRAGLNLIARQIMENYDADSLLIHGASRTTGRNSGRTPKPVRFRR